MIRRYVGTFLIIIESWIDRFKWEALSARLKYKGKNVFMDFPYNLTGNKYIEIGDNFHACRGCRIQAWDAWGGVKFNPSITIGENVSINMNVDIASIKEVRIGNGVQIASNVLITDHFHGEIGGEECIKEVPPANRRLYSKGSVIIEDNVWIGSNVSILPGVVIGKNAIIGAGSVITKSVPPNCVAAGNPAKIIQMMVDTSNSI